MDARSLVAAVDRLTRSAAAGEPMTLILGRLCDAAHEVFEIDGAGVILVRDRTIQPLASRGMAVVEVLDREQIEAQAGPSLASIQEGDVVLDDVGRQRPSRWPAFASTAARLGVHAVAALPLRRDDRTWAVLTLYRRERGAWQNDELTAARMLADLALSHIVTAAAWETLLQAQNDLARRAWHDDLTGLPRRSLLLDRLSHALASSKRSGSPVAVLFVDLDGFKQINDTFGHAVGDAVLVEVADRMTTAVRAGDSVSRLAGDEFVVVCENLGHAGLAVLDEAAAVTERLRHAISAPITLEGVELAVAASVGLALSTEVSSAEGLIAAADAAMYAEKHRRRIEARATPPPGSRAPDDIDLTRSSEPHDEASGPADVRSDRVGEIR
jgi:diguanylate cyclase (GGDEF)-like protein